LNSLPADQQVEKAIELAKKEGSVNVYGSITPTVFDQLKKAFTSKYGISVNDFRGSPETVLQRVTQELQANRAGADVVDISDSQMADLADEGGLMPHYSGPQLAKVDKAGVFEDWLADRFDLLLPAWNTDIIKPGDEPRSWTDLADPKYNGKMTIEGSDSEWFGALTIYWLKQGKSQSEIDQLWKDIANGASISKGHTAMASLLSAGQQGLEAMNYTYIIDLARAKGAPVDYRSADGIAHTPGFLLPFGLGAVKNAPHPAAAWLFINWMLSSPGGQDIFAASSVIPSTEVSGNKVLDGVTTIPFPVEEAHKNQKQYDTEFDALLRGVS